MHFLVTVGYETEQLDRSGNPRLQKIKYVVQAESMEEATLVMSKFRAEDRRASQSMAINQLPIDCVIDEQNTPQYYQA